MSNASRRAQQAKRRQQRLRRVRVVALSGVVLVGALIAVLVVSGGGEDDAGNLDGKIDIEMFDYGFAGDLTAPAGPIELSATNVGRLNHNIGIRGGPISQEVGAGGRVSLDLGEVPVGTYELYCDVIGHEAKGMVATLVITEPEPDAASDG